MTRTEDVLKLKALFEEAAGINREALSLLRSGHALEALVPLFERKSALAGQLQALQQGMDSKGLAGAQEPLQGAFQAQREAATTEAQLAELLGKIVPQSGNAAAAYGQFNVVKRVTKLDSSV